MEKLHLIMKIVSAIPSIISNIEEISEDRFISIHELLCAIENAIEAFGLNTEEVGILITKDGDVHFVLKGVLKDKLSKNNT